MQRYVLAVRDRAITAESTDTTLVRTSQGVDEIAIRFYSPEWLEDFSLSCALYVGDVLEEQALTLVQPLGAEWLAEAVIAVPDTVLESAGELGVTVHGVTSGNEHIITERAFPLTVMLEGDGIGESPQPNP